MKRTLLALALVACTTEPDPQDSPQAGMSKVTLDCAQSNDLNKVSWNPPKVPEYWAAFFTKDSIKTPAGLAYDKGFTFSCGGKSGILEIFYQ